MRIIIGKWSGNFETIIIIILLIVVIVSHVGCSCSKMRKNDYYSIFSDVREGFANIGSFGSGSFASAKQPPPNTKKWEQPNLVIAPDTPLPQGVVDILHRKGGKVPLPSDQKQMFLTTPFKPECCPNTFSNSMGCACMSLGQYKYLNERGGNNVPKSEY
jgi:hypothetical protein